MGTYSAWERTAKMRLLSGARGLWAPTGGGEGQEHIVSPRAQLVVYGAGCKILTTDPTSECKHSVTEPLLNPKTDCITDCCFLLTICVLSSFLTLFLASL